ncbi:hypothetical protein N0V94_004469 [Neodidymelliopsis sp. IMI 364377]|nr:hypothetical protein N0V94_004469 [Neodidymelliopsis sp. IMI 364377]
MASPAAHSFASVDTTTQGPHKDEVESPSISVTNALARYEYDHASPGGTKILMVEWEDDDSTRGVRGDWHVSWEGSTRVLPADDQQASDVNRMYFLLPPGVAVPKSVTLTHRPQEAGKTPVVWHTNPLPALFPPELGASARAAGKKGVLHTIWAKKRLQVLQKEIEAESRDNVEGIGLLMAVQEKEWIEQTFGVSARPSGLSISLPTGPPTNGPASPKSPGGGRLLDKLAGLKLSTNQRDLTPKLDDKSTHVPFANPLSPEGSDVAISSFSSFAMLKGENPSSLAAKPPQPPQPLQTAAPRKIAVQVPPPSIVSRQDSTGMASLNALSSPAPIFQSREPIASDDDDKDDGLFASPIDPRSPEIGKSPFSFAGNDTAKYLHRDDDA